MHTFENDISLGDLGTEQKGAISHGDIRRCCPRKPTERVHSSCIRIREEEISHTGESNLKVGMFLQIRLYQILLTVHYFEVVAGDRNETSLYVSGLFAGFCTLSDLQVSFAHIFWLNPSQNPSERVEQHFH